MLPSNHRKKNNIAIAILENLQFLKGYKNYFIFDGSNNIFADCIVPHFCVPNLQ